MRTKTFYDLSIFCKELDGILSHNAKKQHCPKKACSLEFYSCFLMKFYCFYNYIESINVSKIYKKKVCSKKY